MSIVVTPSMGSLDIISMTDHLSQHFTVADLTKSETADRLGIKNLPDAEALENLRNLAAVYETILARVGPFTTLSSFRNQELQNALKAGAAGSESAKMAVDRSYHTLGIAGDIRPTTMSVEEFYTKLWNDPGVKKVIGQVAYKPTQNAVHISFQTDRFPTATPMKVLSTGEYVRLDEDEKEAWLVRYPVQIGVGIAGVILISLAAFLIVQKLRSSPEIGRAIAARASSIVSQAKEAIA